MLFIDNIEFLYLSNSKFNNRIPYYSSDLKKLHNLNNVEADLNFWFDFVFEISERICINLFPFESCIYFDNVDIVIVLSKSLKISLWEVLLHSEIILLKLTYGNFAIVLKKTLMIQNFVFFTFLCFEFLVILNRFYWSNF